MKTFQIRITKEGKHRCIKFKSELPMESVLAAVKAVVKNTYHVSIKEIHWRVPEERDIMWAIREASAVRFYHKVWKDIFNKVEEVKHIGNIIMPKHTIVSYNVTENTFFNISVTKPWCIKLDTDKVCQINPDLNIHRTVGGAHTFYLVGKHKIAYKDCGNITLISFFKIETKTVITGEIVTEEL